MGLKVTETTFRRGGESSRGGDGRSAKRTFSVVYDADTPPTSFAEIETADDGTTAIPTVRSFFEDGDELPGDDTRYANRASVKPLQTSGGIATGLEFEVEVEYTDSLIVFDPLGADPLEDPDRIERGGAEGSEDYFEDRSDTPQKVVNTAGAPYDRFLSRDNGSLQWVVTRNVAAPDVELGVAYLDAVNSDAFTLGGTAIAIGQAKMGLITWGPKMVRNDIEYYEQRMPIKLREKWTEDVDSFGYAELVSGVPKPILDANKQPITKPWPLDAVGAKMPNPGDDPAVTTYKPYFEKPYSVFAFT